MASTWTTYSPTLLTAIAGLIVLITVPIIAIKGGYRWMLRGLRTLFHIG